MRAIVFVVL